MREIKFRAKRIDNGEWVYGYYCFNPFFKRAKIFSFDNIRSYVYEVIPETVGQYTGLKDNTKWEQLTEQEQLDFYNRNKSEDGITIKYRNVNYVRHLWKGKEIYEGDICTFAAMEWLGKQEIRFEQATFKFGIQPLWTLNIEKIEVVGNIHDNPELLKEVGE